MTRGFPLYICIFLTCILICMYCMHIYIIRLCSTAADLHSTSYDHNDDDDDDVEDEILVSFI